MIPITLNSRTWRELVKLLREITFFFTDFILSFIYSYNLRFYGYFDIYYFDINNNNIVKRIAIYHYKVK